MTSSINALLGLISFGYLGHNEQPDIPAPQPIGEAGSSLTERAVKVVGSVPRAIINAVTDWFYPSITCTPEKFKELLSQNYRFPPKVIVTGNLEGCFEELPAGLEVHGSLDLRGSGLRSLPDGLKVGGDLNLYRCTGLTSLPEGLVVEGKLDLSDCTGLISLPEGLEVGGDLNLSGCRALISLPEGLKVEGDLILSRCTGLLSLPEGLEVEGNLCLCMCESLTSLPQRLVVGDDLNLGWCTGLLSLPEGLEVGGDLNLCGCRALISLPEGLNFGGHLNLSDCRALISLPEGLNFGGDLNLSDCSALISLPDGLKVGGDLNLGWCTGLLSLPDGLKVGGDLNLYRCTGLTSLPEGLVVEGKLDLSDCTGLISLPEGLKVGRILKLSGCTGLISLPDGLKVEGDLILSSCTGLLSLPEGLEVEGNLCLYMCESLTSLPQRLVVGDDLNLGRCTGLLSLPEGLEVEGNLCLDMCESLTSLPTWITTLGPRATGGIRSVNLERTGLSNAIIERLRRTPAPGMTFSFSHEATQPTIEFSTLDEVLNFWFDLASDKTLAKPEITIEQQHLANVLRFLARLTTTAEYQNLQTRPLLACRILEALNQMALDDEINARLCDLIGQGLSSCDDRIISALEEIELVLLLDKIEKTNHTVDELKKLGKSFMLLEMVNAKAKAHKATLTWVDEIEVYLAFQIGLASRFNLPVKTRNMIFRGCAQVTDAQLKAYGDQIEAACTEERLTAYLKTWSPWMKNERFASVPAYETLELDPTPLSPDDTCIITQDAPKQPVLYAGRIYDYAEFVKWYVNKGTDPMTRLPINLNQLKKLNK